MFVIKEYQQSNGQSPFSGWLKGLDRSVRIQVLRRIARFEDGLFGDCKNLENKLFEARFFIGPGYRVYFSKFEESIVLLLAGGDKSSQRRDIARAKNYLSDYLENQDV